MNDTLKTHKKKIIGGGAGVTAVGIILFFWQLGVGPGDLKALPELSDRMIVVEQRVNQIERSLMSEIAKSSESREQMIREVATLAAGLEAERQLQENMREDIQTIMQELLKK